MVTHESGEEGFSLVEVLVAIVVLVLGVTALVGTSALVTRQVGRGRIVTIANHLAVERLDALRRAAAVRDPSGARCTDPAFASGGPVTERNVTYSWAVTGTGGAREVSVTASYPVARGTSTFTITTVIGCY